MLMTWSNAINMLCVNIGDGVLQRAINTLKGHYHVLHHALEACFMTLSRVFV